MSGRETLVEVYTQVHFLYSLEEGWKGTLVLMWVYFFHRIYIYFVLYTYIIYICERECSLIMYYSFSYTDQLSNHIYITIYIYMGYVTLNI